MNIITEEKPFFMIGMHIVDDNLYGLTLDGNQIYKMNLNDGEYGFFRNVEVHPKTDNRLYHYVAVKDGKSYFVPFHGEKIAIYNHGDNSFEYIPIDLPIGFDSDKTGRFYNIAFFRNKLFLIPFGFKAIMCFDLECKTWHIAADLREEFDEKRIMLFSRYVHIDDHTIVLASLFSNAVFIFDMQTESIEKRNICDSDVRFSAITYYDNNIWMVAKNKLRIYQYDFENGDTKVYDQFPKECREDSKHCFDDKAVLLRKEYLYCFPAGSNMAIRMNLKTKSIEKLDEFEELCNNPRLNLNNSIFDGCAYNGDNICLHYQLNKIIKYNLKTRKIASFDRKVSLKGWLSGILNEQ